MARVGSHNSVSSSDFAQPKWRPGLVGPTSYHWTAGRIWSSWAARFERAESALTARTGQQHMSSRKRFAAMSARSTGVAQRWRRHEGARAGAGFDGSGQRTCVIRNGPDSSDASRRRICGLGVRAGVVEAPRVAAVAVALRPHRDRSRDRSHSDCTRTCGSFLFFPHRPVLWDRARSQSPRATQCHPVSANRHPAGWHGRPRSRSCAHLRCRRGTPWALGPRTCYVCSSSPRRSRARSSPADARSPWPRRRRPTVSVLTRASALAAMRPNHHFDALLHCNTPAAPPRAHSHALAHAAE